MNFPESKSDNLTESGLVCVVIPVYSSVPSKSELLSLEQCFRVLNKYPIFIIAPEGLDLSQYYQVEPLLSVINIPLTWQKDIQSYNKLKTNSFFYSLFKNYTYLLTYELDSFVFKDELEYWCQQQFDYIGAPWFTGFSLAADDSILCGVGNSGFSLRNIKTCNLILKRLRILKILNRIYLSTRLYKLISPKYFFYLCRYFFKMRVEISDIHELTHDIYINEDIFWGKHVPAVFPEFKVASIEEAIKFSFEVNPALLFKMNKGKLPFGCHAWQKYDPLFWADFVKVEYNVVS